MTKKILIAIGIIVLLADTIATFTPRTAEKLSASSNINSINLVPSATVGGDTYALALNGTTVIGINGGLTAPTSTFSEFGPLLLAYGGYAGPFSTSTTFTAAQLLVDTNQQWLGTSAVATATLPAATTTYAGFTTALGAAPAYGALYPFKVTNDSTNTINYPAPTGFTYKCEVTGVGTTTVQGGCTSSSISVPATSTAYAMIYFDTSSSTGVIEWGNSYH